MAWIGFDSERLKSPQSGLGKFCAYLGNALLEEKCYDIQFFQKHKTERLFPAPAQYGKLYDHNKFLGVSTVVDVWHCTHQLSSYLPADKSIPIVTTIHDLNFVYESSHEFKVKRKLGKVQQIIDRSSAVIFISKFTEEEVRKHLKLNNVYTDVIYNAPALPVIEIASVNKRIKPYFFSIGLITAKKNYHTLIPLLIDFPDHELIIAGNRSDAYAEKLMERARKLGVQDRLILTGEITEDEKVAFYQHCDAFFMPSVAEGFGLPVIEAMHFGKPVFLSTFGSLPEIGGQEAYYWNSFEKEEMRQVLKNGLSEFSEEKAKSMKKRAAQFSWKRAAEKYCEVYERLLKI